MSVINKKPYIETVLETLTKDNLTNNDKTITTDSGFGSYIHDNTYTDAASFKTAMSGVYLYYELATPIETDISGYLPTNKISVIEGGTTTFNNTYNQAVPSDIDYLIEEVKE